MPAKWHLRTLGLRHRAAGGEFPVAPFNGHWHNCRALRRTIVMMTGRTRSATALSQPDEVPYSSQTESEYAAQRGCACYFSATGCAAANPPAATSVPDAGRAARASRAKPRPGCPSGHPSKAQAGLLTSRHSGGMTGARHASRAAGADQGRGRCNSQKMQLAGSKDGDWVSTVSHNQAKIGTPV